MIGSIVLALAGMVGIISPGIQNLSDASKIWVPKDAQAIKDEATFNQIWGSSYQRTQIWVTRSDGGNVLTRESIQELYDFDQQVRDLQVDFPDEKDTRNYRDIRDRKDKFPAEKLQWTDVCAPTDTGGDDADAEEEDGLACLIFAHPLEWWYYFEGSFTVGNDYVEPDCDSDTCDHNGDNCYDNGDPKTGSTKSCTILQRINSGKGADQRMFPPSSDRNISTVGMLGGIEYDDKGFIKSAKAIAYTYLLDKATDENDPKNQRIAGWEYGFTQFAMTWNDTSVEGHKNHKLNVYTQCSRDISDELSALISPDVIKVNMGLLFIIVYAILVLGKFHPVRNRSCLAFSGIVSVGLAIGMAYGVASMIGFYYTPVTGVLPFILIGIGVDDMFVLVNAYDNCASEDLEERMRETFSEAGVSITITSFTDFFAFALGATSTLPALENFCAYAALGILFDYILQISLFGSAMVYDAKRQAAGRKDCCGACCCKPTSFFCCGGNCAKYDEGALKRCIRNRYAPMIASRCFRILVIFIFVGWFGVSAYLATFLRQDFSFRWFVPSDSRLIGVFDIQDKYFGDLGLPVSVTTGTQNGTKHNSIKSQSAMLKLDDAMKKNEWLQTDTVDGWYPAFVTWIKECKDQKNESWPASWSNLPNTAQYERMRQLAGTKKYPHCEDKELDTEGYVPEDKFYGWMREWTDVNITRSGARYASNILWDDEDEKNKVTYTKIRATYKSVTVADEQIASMNTLREDCSGEGRESLEAVPFMFMYLYYEQYAVIIREGVTNLALALVAVMVIVSIMLCNCCASLLVFLCIVMIDVDILGMMYLWDISIDSVAVANLVLAIGLAVDYSVHVAHAFLNLSGTPIHRAQVAMIDMGTSVLHGGISTFVAVVILSTSKSYIFVVFFKMFFGICVFGLTHGMIFLPVCLAIFAPKANADAKDAQEALEREYVLTVVVGDKSNVQTDTDMEMARTSGAKKIEEGAL